MKSLVVMILALFASSAFAAPGKSQLICQSAANSGGKQKLNIEINRSTDVGTVAPTVKISVDGKDYPAKTPDIRQNYGESTHDAVLGVIVVTADNLAVKNTNRVSLKIMGVPASVKAFDQKGNQLKWNLQQDDGGECADGYGKATFQGVFNGFVQDLKDNYIQIDTQILDCTMTYDTGSAC